MKAISSFFPTQCHYYKQHTHRTCPAHSHTQTQRRFFLSGIPRWSYHGIPGSVSVLRLFIQEKRQPEMHCILLCVIDTQVPTSLDPDCTSPSLFLSLGRWKTWNNEIPKNYLAKERHIQSRLLLYKVYSRQEQDTSQQYYKGKGKHLASVYYYYILQTRAEIISCLIN